MNRKLIIIVCVCFSACMASSTDVPYAEISNGLVKAKLFLPDMERGYYQATRFDWSGVISELEFEGHNYFGQWFQKYDPKIHDAILGPVESFAEIGYAQAAVGSEFLRIGVGGLLKEDDSRMDAFKLYQISNPGKWTVKKSTNQVVFTHEIIENLKTGAGVRITCDRPISKIVYWASATTSCPEPYIDVNVAPGEEFKWKNTYQFYK